MSTRKTTGATATKVENATTATTTTTATTGTISTVTSMTTTTISASSNISINAEVDEKVEMGVNASVSAAPTGTTTTEHNSNNDAEVGGCAVITGKDKTENNTKPLSNEPKRITRNSPLLLASPTGTGGAKKEAQQRGSNVECVDESESEDGGGSVSSTAGVPAKRHSLIRGRKSLKEAKEAKEATTIAKVEAKDMGENACDKKGTAAEQPIMGNSKEIEEKDSKEAKDIKEDKEKETKDSKEIKEASECIITSVNNNTIVTPTTTTSTVSVAAINRVTRKAAHELIPNTRITRNRQTPGAINNRPETPPVATFTGTRGRRGAAAKRGGHAEVSAKRKRSVEEPTSVGSRRSSSLEPGPKYIKIEVKDETETVDDELRPPSSASAGGSDVLDQIKIKQELVESDESATDSSLNATVTTTSGGGVATAVGRGRRWSARKSQQSMAPIIPISPSTRATRHNKVSSPSPTPTSSSFTCSSMEPKRRRMGSVPGGSSTITRSSSLSLLKNINSAGTLGTTPTAAAHAPDEDSKDSMASSMDEVLVEIKSDKMNSEHEETDCELDEKLIVTEKSLTSNTNGLVGPLTVDTDVTMLHAEKDGERVITDSDTSTVGKVTTKMNNLETVDDADRSVGNGSGSEKAASLSPEMVSEGVSEISVKQFYKKPKFLENNLGIEEDPKLGEIVQKASTVKDINDLNGSEQKKVLNEKAVEEEEHKVKEKSLDDQNAYNNFQKADTNDDSASTNHYSPLIVEDEEEDEIGETKPIEQKANDSKHVAEEECKDRINEEESSKEIEKVNVEEADDEDDGTIEENDAMSMDNNASLHDDAPEERDDELEEEPEALMEQHIELKIPGVQTEKTKTEICDKKEQVQLETKENIDKVETEKKTKPETESEPKSDKKESLVSNEKETVKIPNSIENANKDESVDKKDIDNKAVNILDDDADVLAKIEAELKKIREKQKNDLGQESPTTQEEEENKENLLTTETEISQIPEEAKLIENVLEVEHIEEEGEQLILHDDDEDEEDGVLVIDHDRDDELMDVDQIAQNENKVKDENLQLNEKTLLETTAEEHTENILQKLECEKDEDDSISHKSEQSNTDTNSWVTFEMDNENEETLRQKEQHLQNLGLLTHKAAEKRRQDIQQAAETKSVTQQHQHLPSGNGKRNGKLSTSAAVCAAGHEYTGTLKTVIKLNRNGSGGNSSSSSKKNAGATAGAHLGKEHASGSSGSGAGGMRRQSLKMTFQKGRGRHQGTHADRTADQQTHGEDAYYTIQNENEGAQKSNNSTNSTTSSSIAAATTTVANASIGMLEHSNVVAHTHGRKIYSRSNINSHNNNNSNTTTTTNTNSSHSEGNDAFASVSSASVHINTKKDEKEEILIPEKASSFKFHPGRLCEDQCFYCSGKFGLYDTPCHVGQIKSVERQQKILANEEKLTVDNCLCDACFRHVDRRANVPSYKKRISASGNSEVASTSAAAAAMASNAGGTNAVTGGDGLDDDDAVQRKCLVPDCPNPAGHSLRRKCIRKSVKKFLLNFELPTGSPYVWLCQNHYSTVIQSSGCVLCKRRLGKNHMYHITSDTDRLEKALSEMGIPVQLGIGTAVCKLCRYFANLLMKPPDSTKSQKAEFVKNYRKRLLQFHNIHDGSNEVSEMDEEDSNGASVTTTNTSQKKKQHSPSNSNKRDTNTPMKDLPSPNGSSGSSVECLGEAATANAVPASVALGGINTEQQQQMLLDNDVFVGYDVPMLPTDSNSSSSPASPASGGNTSKQMSKLKAILQSSTNTNNTSIGNASDVENTKADISNVLRANPNISMRELFPGEEDLGLHFKAPFGSSSSQRTPEGWTRVQTFLQYDEPTRRLWEELQKPYGNQSSFLRHLILLEKYFRNGDLVLTPNASSNANVYTRTVRQRLTSYDQGHCGALVNAKPSNAEPSKDKVNVPTVEIKDVDDDEDKETSVSKEHQNKTGTSSSSVSKNANNLSMQLRSRSVSVDKLTKQFSSNAVTIIPRPKDQSAATTLTATTNSTQKSLLKEKDNTTVTYTNAINLTANTSAVTNPSNNNNTNSSNSNSNNTVSSNSRSILKTNLLGMNNKSVEILPLSNSSSSSISGSGSSSGNVSNSNAIKMTVIAGNTLTATESKQQKILDSANKLLANSQNRLNASNSTTVNTVVGGASGGSGTLLTSPPELVSLQRRSAGGNATITATVPVTSNPTASLLANKRTSLPSGNVSGGGKSHAQRVPPNVVILPDTLTPQERLQSKSWRPTLMPVEENQHLMNKGGPLYQTADGRRLPALVQVQSGGKPFLISIFDYNRMCILRREKLLRDRMLQNNNKGRHDAKQQQQQQTQQQQHHQQQQQQHQNQQQQQQQQQQQHQQVQKQHMNANVTNMSGAGYKQLSKQQQVAQQQLLQLQLLQLQKQQQQAVKAATAVRYQPIAPKPSTSVASSVPTSNATGTLNNVTAGAFTAPMNTLLANVINSAAAAAAANANAAAGASNTLNSAPWLWNNYPDANQLLLNGVAPLSHPANSTVVTNTTVANNSKLPQLLPKPVPASSSNSVVSGGGILPPSITSKHQQQLLLDNTLISRIPKSLTVIPQHKLMAHNSGGGNNNSSAAGGSGFKE